MFAFREDAFVFDQVGIRCKWKDPKTQLECGRFLHVIAVADYPKVAVAEVYDIHEMRLLQQMKNIYWVMGYLGIKPPIDDPDWKRGNHF